MTGTELRTRAGSRSLVVCIDDEAPILAAIRRVLRHEPYEVVTTQDPGAVLGLLDGRKVDLIIADQKMPGMTGTELLKLVRARSPETACVMLTGYAEVGSIVGAMNEGAVQRLVQKPWDDEELRGLIRELLDRPGPPADAGRPPPPPVSARRVLRLNCASRRAAAILSELRTAVRAPEEPPPRWVVVLEHLMGLQGSLAEFLQDLVREVVGSGVRASIVDGTGVAGSFLEIVGGSLPVVVYRREDDLALPRRILVVEDQEESMQFLRTLIEAAGHSCETASSASEAVRRLGAEAFDLVLLDLVLPDADGVEVARYLLERGKRIPVVAVSGYLDRWTDASYTRSGIGRQISKPYRVRDILDAIRNT